MKKLKRFIIMLVIMVVIMIAAVFIDKLITKLTDEKFEADRIARHEEVEPVTEELKSAITELSHLSVEEIAMYIEENAYVEDEEEIMEELLEDIVIYDPWSVDTDDNLAIDNNEEITALETVEGYIHLEGEEAVEEEEPAEGAEGTGDSTADAKENDTWEAGSVHENVNRVAELGYKAVENMDSSENGEHSENNADEAKTDSHVNDGEIEGGKMTLSERQKFHKSSEETQLWITADEKVLNENTIDFSNLKIACLGDSVTQGTNLDGEEGYEQYTYPSRLKEILHAESVVNLGIGGSSLGRYWDQAFCDRYQEIPSDTDIIIVLGGYNDGFCLTEDLVGNMDDLADRTLYGDVDDLFKGLKDNYPNAEVIIMTPMSNLLHDVLKKDRPELLSQTVVVNCLLKMAEKYNFDVIDNYNANFLDSRDPDIVAHYLPDSVHPNKEGYEIFAKHVAAQMIRLYEAKAEKEEADKERAEEERIDSTVSSNLDNAVQNDDNSKNNTVVDTNTEHSDNFGASTDNEHNNGTEPNDNPSNSDIIPNRKVIITRDGTYIKNGLNDNPIPHFYQANEQ